uniref:Kazal-like domain-containing protein n=1 Tax=Equus caballus TaxID=9796 RepID=A0A3Q2I9V8_HORSE
MSETTSSNMKAFIFLPFMFLVTFSVPSTQTLKTNVLKLQESPEPTLILERKNEANHQGGQKESNKQEGSNTQGKPGTFSLQGQPGYSNQPGKPGNFNQQKRPGVFNQPGSLQGNSGESNQKGNPETSNEQGKPGSSGQHGHPGSASQQGKPGSSGQQGKPGSSSQQGKPGSSGQRGKSGSFYNPEERKKVGNPLNGNVKDTQTGSTSIKNSAGTINCLSIYKPVCGSDGRTYSNDCVFGEAKRLSNGKLTLKHEGKC